MKFYLAITKVVDCNIDDVLFIILFYNFNLELKPIEKQNKIFHDLFLPINGVMQFFLRKMFCPCSPFANFLVIISINFVHLEIKSAYIFNLAILIPFKYYFFTQCLIIFPNFPKCIFFDVFIFSYCGSR